MANGGFILQRFPIAELTATSFVENYPVENLITKDPNAMFKSDISEVGITVELEEPQQNIAFGFINSMLSTGDSIRIRVWDSGFNYPTNPILFESDYPATAGNFFCINDNFNGKYFSIKIESSNIALGNIHIGKVFQFPNNYIWGKKTKYCYKKVVTTTEGGIHYESPDPELEPGASVLSYPEISMTFKGVYNSSNYRQLLYPGDKIFCPDMDNTTECFYGIVKSNAITEIQKREGASFAIDFLGHAIQS